MKRASFIALLIVLSVVLGATVLREPIATAAAPITNVFVTNTAANPVPVQQQGTAQVAGNVQVAGTVSARPAAPAAIWQATTGTIGNQRIPLAGPSSSPINLTSLTLSPVDSGGVVERVILDRWIVAGSASNCDAPEDATVLTLWNVANVSAPLNVTFPTPLQAQPLQGKQVCLVIRGTNSGLSDAIASASGFLGG